MNEKIFLRVRFSVDDYVRVLTFMKSQFFINKYIFLVFPAVIFAAIVFIVYESANDKSSINWSSTLIAAAFPALMVSAIVYLLNKFFSAFMLRRAIAKQYKSAPVMQEETEIVISRDGIETSSNLSSGKLKWEAIIKAVESETDFIFYTTGKFGNFIPKNAFASETDIYSLRCLSRLMLGDKAKF